MSAPTPAERAQVIAGLRELADLLEAHLPLGPRDLYQRGRRTGAIAVQRSTVAMAQHVPPRGKKHTAPTHRPALDPSAPPARPLSDGHPGVSAPAPPAP